MSLGGTGVVAMVTVPHQEVAPVVPLMKGTTHIVARDAEGNLIGESWSDLSTIQLGKFVQQALLAGVAGAAINILDVNNANVSISSVNFNASLPFIVSGTSATAPNFNDYNLGTFGGGATSNYAVNTNYSQNALVAAFGTNNNFTVAGTITNGSGSSITYKEVGLTITVGGKIFLLCHDTVNGGTGYTVSASGTLAVTYTFTFT